MALETGKGTIYGARYYWAKPLGWGPYGVLDSYSEMIRWNVEQFGNNKWDAGNTTPIPGQRWYSYSAKFWFREKDDLAYFILTWS